MPQCRPSYALETARPSRSRMLYFVTVRDCKLVLPLLVCFQTQLQESEICGMTVVSSTGLQGVDVLGAFLRNF